MLGFKEIQVEVFVGVEIIPLFHKSMTLDIIHQSYSLIKRNQHGLILENGNASFEPIFGEARISVDITSIGMDTTLQHLN